jgi:hypothetical protein
MANKTDGSVAGEAMVSVRMSTIDSRLEIARFAQRHMQDWRNNGLSAHIFSAARNIGKTIDFETSGGREVKRSHGHLGCAILEMRIEEKGARNAWNSGMASSTMARKEETVSLMAGEAARPSR